MSNTKLHPAVEALEITELPWEVESSEYSQEWEPAYYAGPASEIEKEADAHLIAAAPEMLSWMVKDLTVIGMSDAEMQAHKRQGRDIIRRASNDKIKL